MPQFTAAGSVLVALVGTILQQGIVSQQTVSVVELSSASAPLFEDSKPPPATPTGAQCAPPIVVDVSALEKRLERFCGCPEVRGWSSSSLVLSPLISVILSLAIASRHHERGTAGVDSETGEDEEASGRDVYVRRLRGGAGNLA